ncbi:uncharacterized protein SCHCODRAFT_02641447 [Schizophyllum commune H4-8]|uniref:Expressed protein n=1 Tax=Schizophyllum commune (strain H4-8 / FGSC 9210) TaxID=578458 RepID=D8QJH4_SCHCM|nr:uncharacterized protein SCHCODRAFT_02641447 [Schizophyllum commune H4-8]KAI5886328.1 hypothetical protein SCHCODRAFT_02641447 [Schizophyllum commune H4-8]
MSEERKTETDGSPEAVDRQSPRFASTDEDIIVFRSTDGTLFNIHSCNLRCTTDGPLAENFTAVPGEKVQLTEDAKTLDMLFGFVYPSLHPSLVNIPFPTFAAVAEAAEKYHVAPARTVCRIIIRVSELYKEHPLEILEFAFRHGHHDLLDHAAPYSLRVEMRKARQTLSLPLFAAWVDYRQAFNDAFWCSDIRFRDCHEGSGDPCPFWPEVVFAVDKTLEKQRGHSPLYADLDALFKAGKVRSVQCNVKGSTSGTGCSEQLLAWRESFIRETSSVLPLSRIFACTN